GAAAAAAAAAPLPLTLGFDDGGPLASPSTSVSDPWLSRATNDGAQIVRVTLPWSAVTPAVRPSGFRPADPASPGYSWSSVDSRVRSLSSRGVQVLLMVLGAPSWAEGRGRPRGAPPGAWRPDPKQLGLFAHAAALRYSGRYPDPQTPGKALPRVRYWEAWNEPNLPSFLSPQWTRSGRRYVASSPILYRRMLNAFYPAVKQVAPSNVVVAGGTAPFGDAIPGSSRMTPVLFWQQLMCLGGAALHAFACDPAHFDVLDHHPFDVGGPLQPALDPGDVSVPDMGKLTRLLDAAVRDRSILPRGPKAVWTTELGWASRPPEPLGVPLARQAHWLEQALYVLWHEGVSTVLWLEISDQTSTASPTSLEVGLYFRDGAPKPAVVAYRFPFLTTREGGAAGKRILAWGRAPATGELRIEVRSGGRWSVLRSVSVSRSQVFSVQVPLPGRATLRAQLGTLTSLTWDQS
ncbi:MAG: hypothetical protein M3071_21865, partial [Actinomycetota bacterium]|nr:hypothetical protein [Actinomycetota bacterium]